MSNAIKSVNRSTNVSIAAEINGASVYLNYSIQGNTPPANVNVNANFNGEGTSSSLNRNYFSANLDYGPKPAVEIYPFDTEFEAELTNLVGQVYEKYAEPESITI